MYGPAYATYHARDWAEGKTSDQIADEIAACAHRARTHRWKWNEVGNVADTWTRVDVLTAILAQRRVLPI